MATKGPPLVVLASLASKLLGRAVAACLAPLAAPMEHSVVLEIHQSSQSPGRLQLRVCDDGAAMAADTCPLERWAVGLGPLLACPVFEDAQLLAQSKGLEEAVVRRYSFQAGSEGGDVSLHVVGDAAKPPGSTLCGSVFQLTILLQQQLEPSSDSGSHQQPVQLSLTAAGLGQATPVATQQQQQQQQRLPASADEVVCCLRQLLGMVRVLAPPVRLLMRLNGVLLQVPDGSLQPASGSCRLDLSLPASLHPLRRLQKGIASEFLASPPALSAAAQGQRPAAAEHFGPEAVQGQAPSEQLAHSAASGPEAASTAAAPARVMQGSQPLLYVGVGEAGWGCAAAVQQFRGVKWAARAGLVLQVPDHEALQAAAAAQAAAGQQASRAPDGGAQGGYSLAGGGTPPTPVCVFRSWELQLGPAQQQHVQRGLEKCAWGSYGFALQSISSSPDGALEARLACAEPRCGALITACVLHLTPCEYQSLAEAGQHPGLPKSHEARLVSRALEAALQHLKQQCPALLSSRRERSLARSLPLLGSALAGILHQSAEGDVEGAMQDEGSALYHGCTMVGCEPEDLQRGILQLLQQVASAPLAGATAAEKSVAAQPESQSLSADADSNIDPQY